MNQNEAEQIRYIITNQKDVNGNQTEKNKIHPSEKKKQDILIQNDMKQRKCIVTHKNLVYIMQNQTKLSLKTKITYHEQK